MTRILVIDDDLALCELLAEYLAPEGFEVETVYDGQQGALRAVSAEHDLVILDVMLPRMSGFDVLRQIREESRIPVLMLTARGDDVDRIVGLEMGADDYLPKPFNPRELLARVRAIQRRTEEAGQRGSRSGVGERLEIADLLLKRGSREVQRQGEEVDLTSVEFSLLDALLQRAGEVTSREDLVKQVLGRTLSPYDRSIDVHISSLRKKLGPLPDGRERIKTVRGVGYLYTIAET